MTHVTIKDAGGNHKGDFMLADGTTVAALYDKCVDDLPISDPDFVLGLWDPHHKNFYPLNELSLKPIAQFVNKGGGNEELSVYLLSKQDIRHTTTERV